MWVFGMVDTSTTPSLGYMRLVPDRTAAIIQQHTKPGTVVHSDQWSAYRQVASLPNVASHETVNHSVEFVSPTGVHTENIEGYWSRVKHKFKRMKGCYSTSYIDEFMWRERHGKTAGEAFRHIIRDINIDYPL